MYLAIVFIFSLFYFLIHCFYLVICLISYSLLLSIIILLYFISCLPCKALWIESAINKVIMNIISELFLRGTVQLMQSAQIPYIRDWRTTCCVTLMHICIKNVLNLSYFEKNKKKQWECLIMKSALLTIITFVTEAFERSSWRIHFHLGPCQSELTLNTQWLKISV